MKALVFIVLFVITLTFFSFSMVNQEGDEKVVLLEKEIYHLVYNYDTFKDSRRFCTLESLLKTEGGVIWVWLSDKLKFPPTFKYPNVELKLISKAVFEQTPFEKFYSNNKTNYGRFSVQNFANAFRLAVVFKFGGTYLDSDFILTTSLASMDNSVALQDNKNLNNAFFKFKRKSPILHNLMVDFVNNYNGDRWGHQGPGLFTRAILNNKECAIQKSTIDCFNETLNLLAPIVTSPVPWNKWKDFLDKTIPSNSDIKMFHLWNKLSENSEWELFKHDRVIYNKTLVGSLRRTFCPVAFEYMYDSYIEFNSRS